MDNEKQILNKIEKFHSNIYEFSRRAFDDRSVDSLIRKGLEVFNSFPGACCSAYFMLDKETFEFKLNQEHANIDKLDFNKIYSEALNNGLVGKAMTSGQLSIIDYNSCNNKIIGATPLITSSGITGLILFIAEKDADIMNLLLFNSTNLFSNILATYIENFTLNDNAETMRTMLDQIVAERTIHLQESKFKTEEKVEYLKSNIAMSIPHEVRTPINQILGLSDFLIKYSMDSNSDDRDDLMELFNDIRSSAQRLKRLFENYILFANLSVISQNLNEIQKLRQLASYYVKPLIFEKAMLIAEGWNRMQDIEIDVADANLALSEQYLIKIIEELLDNAMKFSEPGVKVKVTSEIKDDFYLLSFYNEGRGLTKTEIEKIDAYQQFERTVYEQQGMGLGLSIVWRILDIHGGSLSIESEPGKYTLMKVTLPLSMELPEDYED
jgi:K+-sensing histidine kinase KdpD